MIYVLLIVLLVLLVLCYLLSGKDFFAPSTVQILTFVVATFMCIYFMWSLDCLHDFQWKTIGMIAGAMAMSVIIGILVHRLFAKVDITPHTPDSVDISPISTMATFFILGIQIITLIWFLIEIRRIGGVSGSFSATMHRFHAMSSYSVDEDGRIPWLLSQLIRLMHVLFLLFSFNLIRFWKYMSNQCRFIDLFIIFLCSLIMALTGRMPVVNNLMGSIVMFHLLRVQKQGGYKQYSLKSFFRVGILLIFVMAMFFLSKSFVGRASRNETMNAVDYIAYYTGSGLIAFDKYLQHPTLPSDIFGKETFYRLIQFLSAYGFISVPPYITHLEFRSVGAGFTNNVYTFLRIYHHDFGMVGTFLFHGFSIVFLSVFYEYVKKKRGNIGILVFSMMYYSIVMSFFTERFFTQIVSPNFLKMLAIMFVLYELLIRKRIRLKFRRTDYVLHPIPIRQESHSIDS